MQTYRADRPNTVTHVGFLRDRDQVEIVEERGDGRNAESDLTVQHATPLLATESLSCLPSRSGSDAGFSRLRRPALGGCTPVTRRLFIVFDYNDFINCP